MSVPMFMLWSWDCHCVSAFALEYAIRKVQENRWEPN
jgi:hypothetical protein